MLSMWKTSGKLWNILCHFSPTDIFHKECLSQKDYWLVKGKRERVYYANNPSTSLGDFFLWAGKWEHISEKWLNDTFLYCSPVCGAAPSQQRPPQVARGYCRRMRRKTTLIGSTSASHRTNEERGKKTHTYQHQKVKHVNKCYIFPKSGADCRVLRL